MVENEILTFLVDGRDRLRAQLLQQLRRKQGLAKPELLELLGIDQPAGPIVLEDELLLRFDLFAQHILGIGKLVADDLEDHVE